MNLLIGKRIFAFFMFSLFALTLFAQATTGDTFLDLLDQFIAFWKGDVSIGDSQGLDALVTMTVGLLASIVMYVLHLLKIPWPAWLTDSVFRYSVVAAIIIVLLIVKRWSMSWGDLFAYLTSTGFWAWIYALILKQTVGRTKDYSGE